MKKYSFSKGVWKAAKSVLMLVIPVVAVTSFADINLWDLMVTYVKPILSGATILGTLTFALNWLKVKTSIE